MSDHKELLARLDKIAKRLAQSGASNDAIEVMNAAAAIRSLQEDLAVYKNVVNDCGEGSVKQIRDLSAKLEAERKARKEAEQPEMKHMVDRFLKWKLPPDVQADRCATEYGATDRHGTNLLTAPQAKDMLRYVLKGRATAYGFKQMECDGWKQRATAAEAALAKAFERTRERCAKELEQRGREYVEKWSELDEPYHAKSYAWDALQHAIAIRALAPEESATQTQDNPGDGNDAPSQAGCKSDIADLIPGLEHPDTPECGFDRNSSISENHYVCDCGWRSPKLAD